jgi:hypothetical protein
MADSIREQIISAMTTKLANIRKKYGYNTDCGSQVFRGLPVPISKDYLPASSIMPLLDANENLNGRVRRVMQIRVQGLKEFGSDNPSNVSENVFADLIECIQGIIWTLGYDSGGTNIPVPGDSVIGEDSGATAIIESVSLNSGTWSGGNASGDLALRRLTGEFEDDEELTIAGNAGALTVDGTAISQDAITSTTGGLAENIFYMSGGLDSYPEHDDQVVGATITFNVEYKTLPGNPYSQ